jgi:hypothetical protein
VVAAAGPRLSLVLLLGGCHFASVVTVAGGGWSLSFFIILSQYLNRKYLRTIIYMVRTRVLLVRIVLVLIFQYYFGGCLGASTVKSN